MENFPEFIKLSAKKVPPSQQNSADVEGYYYDSNGACQVAFWECHSDQVSAKHCHAFDEYMICVSGEYTAYVNGEVFVLHPGDELLIAAGSEQWGDAKAGTRTIHVFAGERIKT